ncbi:hypothetical protein OPV22_011592 [Ensete ventricosum]|uniref:Integrase catalytic domain-containing protein n=1 Tax=Ensete ventricosum TaxID=4639 RepID=A0AAV8PXT4_ENSVE|nr:hypothetical protein OPV22_011592 [Ensete ventricosum]
MIKYLAEARWMTARFRRCTITKVPRSENAQADALAMLASSCVTDTPTGAMVRTIGPSISSTMLTVDQEDRGWIDEILCFKQARVLPEDKAVARRIRRTESWYCVVDGRLYRRGFSRPLLRCLNPTEAQTTLAEVHEGISGDHVGARTLAYKILRQGYYWPTLRKDAQIYVRNCEPCQKHSRFQHQPMVPLTTADCAWPFAQWGIDLLGPFPPASGQRRFLIVGVDYFTKWLEAEPLASITERQVEGFVWKNIITRFDLPKTIITDNGTQFNNAKFKMFCQNYRIQLKFSSVAHPQANELAEVTNRAILERLKKRVSNAITSWVEELPSVLWALRTTPKTPTGESPYSLAFGTEVVLPPEVVFPTLRVQTQRQEKSDQQFRGNLDLLEEKRADAHIQALAYRRAVARIYNRRVRPQHVKTGDLVLRKIEVSDPTRSRGKLAPNWEGPYRVIDVIRDGTYTLATMEGRVLPRT